MDYDDNDFQSQNFQLVGDDNNKFPPSLQSFALPKFDLDEHLQVHLRFDSLVETEVLLGIQGQDNNWIDDFSPGTSAIEFSSSAAESCSISRHNNVWSEATSSESVEMLLKSVGEDEMNDKKAIIMESDTHNGLSGTDNLMDPSSRQDDDHNSKMGDIIQTDLALPPDKLQRNLLGLDENASGGQPQVEGMSKTFNDERSGADMGASFSGEKFNSDGKIVDEQCTIDENLTSPLDDTSKKCSAIDENLCDTVQNDNPLDIAFMKKTTPDDHRCDASAVARGSPDSFTCRISQDDPSSISTSNLVMDPGKLNSQILSEQVVEEHTGISMTERSDLLLDDAQKERSQIVSRDGKLNEQYLEGPEVRSPFCSGKSSSFLEPTMDSLVLMREGCNESRFSDNPDGLLEAIAYQGNSLNKASEAGDKILTQAKDMYSLAMEGDRNIETHSVEISNKEIPKLSHLSEGSKDVGYGQPDHLSKVDYSDVDMPIKNAKMVDDCGEGRKLNTLMEVIEEKQYPEGQLTDYNNSDAGNTPKMVAEMHASIRMNFETRMTEIKDKNGSGINFSDFTSRNRGSAVVEKSVDDEVVKDVEKPEAKLNASEDVIPDESPLPALLNDEEVKNSASIPGKLYKVCEVGGVLAEPSDVHITPLEVSIGKEYTLPSFNPGTTNSNNDDNVVMEKAEDASFAGQNADAVTVLSDSSAKKLMQDESVAGLASMVVELDSLEKSTATHQSHPEGAQVVDGIVEQKAETSPTLLAPDSIHSDEKEVKISDHLPVEPVTISDPVVTDGLPPKRMIQDESGVKVASLNKTVKFHHSQDTLAVDVVVEQKEEATSSPCASQFIYSDGKEIKISANSSLSISESNVDAQASSRPVPESDIGEHTLNTTTEPEPTVVGQSSSYVESSVYVACQKELPPSVDKPITHEHAMLVEGNPVVHDSAVKGKDGSDSSGAFSQENKETTFSVSEESASHDERQTLPDSPCAEKTSSGDAPNCYTTTSTPSLTLSRSNAKAQLLEVESGKPSSFEPNCGSPTVISCSEHFQDKMEYREGSRALSDQTNPVSSDVPLISSETGGSADKVDSNVHDSKESTASEDDRSFTFEVRSLADLSERDTGNEWKPFSSMQSSELHQMSKEKSQGCHSESEEGKQHGAITKTPNEDKTRHVTGSSSERLTTANGKPAKETPIPKESIDRDGKSWSTSPISVGTVSRDMQLGEVRQCTYIESSSAKTTCSPIVQASTLPDLNSSVSAAALFHQPFTDLQQVQLRAQIFVYGSLIQGIPPDEACMISAFGETDGGRSLWEGAWCKSVERFQNQKSPVSNCETHFHSSSGVRVPEQVTRCSSLQSKASGTSASRSGSKVVPSAILNSTMPLPSPLWSISTHDGLHSNITRGAHLDFNQTLSPLHSYQSSQTRQYASNSTRWLSPTHPGPWVVSPQSSTLNATMQYSTVPVVETVQVTPVRDSSMPRAANAQLVSPSALLPAPSPASVTAASLVQIETQRKTASPGNNKNASSIQKSRKRKKAAGPEDLGPTIPVSQSSTEPASATVVTKNLLPASADLPLSANTPTKVASGAVVSVTPHISPTHYQIIGIGNTEQRAIFSEEASCRIEQAKLQAEDAAALAAAAVRHSQAIWNQLATQRNSGLVSEAEEKLASAAVAAATAASVAKAAAAAAKVASDAALQAKMMADEAMNSAKTGKPTQSFETGFELGKNLTRLTPGSILKGKDKIHGSTSMISAAREAARRRVESASAATKRAENLDAIVKAAELAAEAVSQAGTIIAMGDPLPFKLSELVEAGSESFWKVHRSTSEKLTKTNNVLGEGHMGLDHGDHHDKLVKQFNDQSSNSKEIQKTATEGGISFNEQPLQLEENYQGTGLGNASTVPNDRHERDHMSSIQKENIIQKGSLVEVVSDQDGLRGGWFSACVLDVKDNKAYVCYNDLLPDKGSGQLKEWISLEGEGSSAPRIRIAHPMIVAKYERTRKRRREAVGNYVWAVGDRVDAWMRDGWWEGIVTEKSLVDETKLTVHFPAGGDSSIVQVWNLRPSLIWKDGQWTEWSRARENTLQPYQGDTPQEKRQKLGRLEAKIDAEVDGREKGKLSKKMPLEDSRKPEESRPLNLSAKDKIFSVGKNVREENVSDALKVKRTGLQKEGSRVVFGVPKPGKKRKFMEVSKHYVSDKTEKISEGNDSLKFAKYLMPQASRLWKNTSKVDPKGKRAGDSKPRGLKSVKSQNIQTRSTSEKDNSSITAVFAFSGGENGHGALPNFRAGFGNEENSLEKKNPQEVGSFPSSLGTTDSLVTESSVQPLPGIPASNMPSSVVEGDLGVKGRLTSSVDKSTRSEEKASENLGKTIGDTIEPRRSNRRIQPTSRLLEGLQSSLIISKIPNFSHDKGAKALHRGSSSSRGNTRG